MALCRKENRSRRASFASEDNLYQLVTGLVIKVDFHEPRQVGRSEAPPELCNTDSSTLLIEVLTLPLPRGTEPKPRAKVVASAHLQWMTG
jgi:hypothetical protein